ncbi:Ig-like domain-containing protein [Methanobrevibacter sp.]|uniref:Ig-like domain-containing protein n=1 Tax=Methanobrevibacter sp. TaxID=66852 RepID=UPI0025CD813C|nr:Ig-like domain-containing protein [Methanobrevibacter sp.]
MKLNKIVVITFFILILFTMGAVSAADENITEAVDDVLSADSADEDEISASSGTFADLQSLVDDAVHGETLYLDKDYSRTDNHKIRISKAITIDGQGHTMDSNYKSNYVFYVTNSGAVIKNLTFINGGDIYVYSDDATCFVYDCRFEKCPAVHTGGAIHGGNAYNCSFVECSSTTGGAICDGNAYNCSFLDCSANFGGAIYSGSAYNCSFVGCHANYYGGAIHGGDAYNCSFTDCSAKEYGGAIYNGDAYGSSFADCSALSSGAAIYAGDAYDSSFVNCSSMDSNAAIIRGNASGCTFEKCSAFAAIHSVKVANTAYGSNAVINVYGDSNVGYVNITIAGVTKKLQPKPSGAFIYFNNVNVGTHDVIVSYSGSSYCEAQTVIKSFKVDKGKPFYSITIKYPYAYSIGHKDWGDIVYTGENVTLYIDKSAANVAGNFHVTINGVSQKVKASSSSKTLEIPLGVLDFGSYNITVSYAGSANCYAIVMSLAFRVINKNPIDYICTRDKPYAYSSGHRDWGDVEYSGQSTALYIYKNAADVPGNFNVNINGVSQMVKASSSVTALQVPLGILKLGPYNITVAYAGNENFSAQTISLAFNVVRKNPIYEIYTNNPNAYSYPYTYSWYRDYGNVEYGGGNATLYIRKNAADVAGNFNVAINGVSQKVKASSGGTILQIPLGVLKTGSYNITVSHAGTAIFNAQTMSLAFKVVKANPIDSIIVAPGNPSNNGQVPFSHSQSKIYIYLKNRDIPSVNVKINGVSYAVNTSGISKFAFRWGIMQPGDYDIEVSYSGDRNYKAQTKPLSFKVVKAKPIDSITISPYNYCSSSASSGTITYDGKDTSLTINLTSNRIAGKVHITVNGASHKAFALSGNSYLDNIPLGILKAGTNVIKVTYSGSAYFEAQEISFTVNVTKANPIKSVSQPAANVGYGENVTIKVDMSNNKINGNVWFTVSDENKTKLTTDKMAIKEGVATCSVPNLAIGKYYLHIYYAGNVNYNAQTTKTSFKVIDRSSELSVINATAGGNA